MKRLICLLVLLPFCLHVEGGFISSAVGGAVGGYVGSKSKSNSQNIIVEQPQVKLEENTIIMKLDTYSTTHYDFSCGKVCIMLTPAGLFKQATYKWITVEEYIRQVHPNMKSYTMTSGNYEVTIIVKLK